MHHPTCLKHVYLIILLCIFVGSIVVEEVEMSLKRADIERLVDVLNDVVEQSSSAQNRNFYQAQPSEIQCQIIQNAYNSGMTVKDISEVVGIATSTVYSKIKPIRR